MLKNINGKLYGYREDTKEWYNPGTYETIPSPLKKQTKKQQNAQPSPFTPPTMPSDDEY